MVEGDLNILICLCYKYPGDSFVCPDDNSTPLSTETTHCGRVLRQVKGSPTNLAIVILVGKVPCIATNHFDHQGNGFRQLGSHGVLAAQLASLGT